MRVHKLSLDVLSRVRVPLALTLVVAGALFLSGCSGRAMNATDVTDTSASLGATATCSVACTYYFQYGPLSSGYVKSTTPSNTGTTNGKEVEFKVPISGLTPGTTYQFQLCGKETTWPQFICVGTNPSASNQPGYFTTTGTAASAPVTIGNTNPCVSGKSDGMNVVDLTKNPTAKATNGADYIIGTSKADVINGRGGNDIICGNGGSDKLSGGDGDDFISGDDGTDTIYGNAGNDTLAGGNGDDTIYGGDGDDQIRGETGNDRVLSGGAGNDVINGGIGDDFLYGGPGADVMQGAAGADRMSGLKSDSKLPSDYTKSHCKKARLSPGELAPSSCSYSASLNDNAVDTFIGDQGYDVFFGDTTGDDVADYRTMTLPGYNGEGVCGQYGGWVGGINLGSNTARVRGGDDSTDSDTMVYVKSLFGPAAATDEFLPVSVGKVLNASGGDQSPDADPCNSEGDDVHPTAVLLTQGADSAISVVGTDGNNTIRMVTTSTGKVQISIGGGAKFAPGQDCTGSSTVRVCANPKSAGISVSGLRGDDVIDARLLKRRIPVRLNGGDGNDKLYGGPGDDILTDGDGADLSDGGPGNDSLYNSPDGSRDDMYGGLGKDVLASEELCTGSVIAAGTQATPTRDSSDFAQWAQLGWDMPKTAIRPGVHVDLALGRVWQAGKSECKNPDKIKGFTHLEGSKQNDELLGSSRDEYLLGRAGMDTLNGRGGWDIIDAGLYEPSPEPDTIDCGPNEPKKSNGGVVKHKDKDTILHNSCYVDPSS